MKTKIIIRDFERTENLETYLRDKIEETLHPFLQKYAHSYVFVKVQEDRHRNMSRKPHFQCEVRIQVPGVKTFLTVQKNGDHFYDCVQHVSDTLKAVMSRQHRKASSLHARRKKSITELPYNFDVYVA